MCFIVLIIVSNVSRFLLSNQVTPVFYLNLLYRLLLPSIVLPVSTLLLPTSRLFLFPAIPSSCPVWYQNMLYTNLTHASPLYVDLGKQILSTNCGKSLNYLTGAKYGDVHSFLKRDDLVGLVDTLYFLTIVICIGEVFVV